MHVRSRPVLFRSGSVSEGGQNHEPPSAVWTYRNNLQNHKVQTAAEDLDHGIVKGVRR